MTGNCPCGTVSVTIRAAPTFINDCNCSLCRRSGAGWGYFATKDAMVCGSTVAFSRPDRAQPAVRVHACSICVSTTHFELTVEFRRANPAADQVGVNMRLFDPVDLTGVEVRFPDGAGWDGVGPYGYRRAPIVIGAGVGW